MATKDIVVPDIGDFDSVEIIEIHVKKGSKVEAEEALFTLESDKAAMDIPAPDSGEIKSLSIKVGDKISAGTVVGVIETSGSASDSQQETKAESAPEPTSESAPTKAENHAEVLVLGAGPGGYTAAFRAADLGKKVILVERYDSLGGVCLNVGCIPSKALLHTAQVINEAEHMAKNGVTFGAPNIDREGVLGFKNRVVDKLTGGLKQLAKQRKVKTITGVGEFIDANSIKVSKNGVDTVVSFDHCIIAAGSQATQIPVFPNDDPRLMDSTGALEMDDIPKKLLIIGGGIIGLEMATVYNALGSEISVVEFMDSLIPGCDKDLVRPLLKRVKTQYKEIMLSTKVTEIKAQKSGLKVSFEGKKAPDKPQVYDKVLVAVGRRPNGLKIGAENAGVNVDEAGFIAVDNQMRTNVNNIFAIGDIVGQPMLAHKATHEAKVAAEVIADLKSFFEPLAIPSVAYTDPEIAWMGTTETEAKEKGLDYEKGAFPWAASGRSLGLDRDEGITKVLFDKKSKRIIGAGIVGPNAGELIAEATLALEMGADMEDIGLTIHPHPTLSETFNFAAEMAEGTITDLYIPKKK